MIRDDLLLPPRWLRLAWLGLVIGVVGYLTVWLPLAPNALRLIGLEMGEWIKFLPQVQAGETPSRNLFYLPPITMGTAIMLLTVRWPGRRVNSWLARGLGLLVAMLAFPSVEAIRFESATEWRLRLGLVAGVALVGLLMVWAARLPRPVPYTLLIIVALVGAILPTWAYWAIRPVIAFWVKLPVGIGPGVWLNLAGHLSLVAAVLASWWQEG